MDLELPDQENTFVLKFAIDLWENKLDHDIAGAASNSVTEKDKRLHQNEIVLEASDPEEMRQWLEAIHICMNPQSEMAIQELSTRRYNYLKLPK